MATLSGTKATPSSELLSGSKKDLEPMSQEANSSWDPKKVAHLLRRATLGAPEPMIENLVKVSVDQAVDHLLALEDDSLNSDPQTVESVRSVGSLEGVQGWWAHEFLRGASPFREKLALFWHGHFATSAEKVDKYRLMMDQIQLFRKHGAGPFEYLVQEISKDPAMVIWLDGNLNRKGTPNENYARELMELFTLGIGNYTEKDIQEAARAFTGWHVKRGRFWFNKNAHDHGEKKVFGKGGIENGDEVVRRCVERKASARFIAGKLFRFYVHPRPNNKLIDHLADLYIKVERNTGAYLKALFKSKLFYSDEVMRAIICSPVDFCVGVVRTLQARVAATPLVEHMARMGQELLKPPNVKGWDGGRTWVGTTGLVARLRFSLQLSQENEDLKVRIPWAKLKLDPSSESLIQDLLGRLFPGEDLTELVPTIKEALGTDHGRKELLALCLQLPESHTI